MVYYPMTTPIKSPDYVSHGITGSILTNRRIDIYVAQGRYGANSQADLLSRIESGKYRTLDAEIRKGNVSPEAQTALNRRVVKDKPTNLPTTAEELLKLLDL